MLTGKKILITGASGGIGSELVNSLLQDGAIVYAVDMNEDGLANLMSKNENSENLHIKCSDLSDEQDCQELVQDIDELHGLVHLAGIFVPDDMIKGDTEKVYDPVMQANIRNIYSLFISCRSKLLLCNSSRVVLVSSVAFNRGAVF